VRRIDAPNAASSFVVWDGMGVGAAPAASLWRCGTAIKYRTTDRRPTATPPPERSRVSAHRPEPEGAPQRAPAEKAELSRRERDETRGQWHRDGLVTKGRSRYTGGVGQRSSGPSEEYRPERRSSATGTGVGPTLLRGSAGAGYALANGRPSSTRPDDSVFPVACHEDALRRRRVALDCLAVRSPQASRPGKSTNAQGGVIARPVRRRKPGAFAHCESGVPSRSHQRATTAR